MRVLVLYAHPHEESFCAALHAAVLEGLREAGHAVDDVDLYAEDFDPVLSRHERLAYHDVPDNRAPVAGHVERLLAAEALVIVAPIWNFGFPAILKGYFDRVFLPGVSFKLVDGSIRPNLWNIRRLTTVTSYGGSRWRTLLMGDPPRRQIKRGLRAVCHPAARVSYLAHYDMNRSTPRSRAAFLARVEQEIARI
jgi:NAD(P)H dehydrogenase (quinone)